MPRQVRKRSSTGMYHIMLRGIDKRNIFLDDEDRERFLGNVEKAKQVGNFKLFGYCLMDNHVHLLVKEDEEIGTSIKRISVGYVGWHNRKYERTGHLFQNRYTSETVETESYLLTVLRYIHQNPVKAGIIKKAEDYQWSSYCKYALDYQGEKSFISSEMIKAYFKTYKDFKNFMNAKNNDECLEYNPVKRYNDKVLSELIRVEYNIDNVNKMPTEKRNEIIRAIYCKKKTSIRQLSRVLGIGKGVIEKILKKDK